MTVSNPSQPQDQPVKNRSIGRWLVLVIAVFFVGLLAYGLINAGEQRIEEGKAPDFTLTTFDGETLRLSEMQGEIVVLNFWSTWCPNCRQEAPLLEELQVLYNSKELIILRVNAKESRETVQKYVEKNPTKLTILLDEKDKVGRLMGVWVHPTTYLIDRQGKIRYRSMGVVNWLSPEVREIIDQLLKESKE